MESKVYRRDWAEEDEDDFWAKKAKRLSRESALALIDECLADPDFYAIYLNSSHRRHGLVKAQLAGLYKVAYPMTAKEAAAKIASLKNDDSFLAAFTDEEHQDYKAADALMGKLLKISMSESKPSPKGTTEQGSLEDDIVYNEARRTLLS